MYIHAQTNDIPSYSGGTSVPTRRGLLSSVVYNIHSDYAPTESCNMLCQLQNKIPDGEWTNIGNATVDGVFHHVHHFRNGTSRGMRAWQTSDPTTTTSSQTRRKRQNPYDQDEDSEGMVGDFYWTSTSANDEAYDTFNSNTGIDDEAANDITNFMESGNYIEACVDFYDTDGVLENGVIAIGWNGEPFIFSSQSALDEQLAQCNLGTIFSGSDGASADDNL
jgi:hypothetical protein